MMTSARDEPTLQRADSSHVSRYAIRHTNNQIVLRTLSQTR